MCFPLRFSAGGDPGSGTHEAPESTPEHPRLPKGQMMGRKPRRKSGPRTTWLQSPAALPGVGRRRKDLRLRSGASGVARSRFPSHDLPSGACALRPASHRPAKLETLEIPSCRLRWEKWILLASVPSPFSVCETNFKCFIAIHPGWEGMSPYGT